MPTYLRKMEKKATDGKIPRTQVKEPIPPLSFNQLKSVKFTNLDLKFYKGSKNPQMPQEFAMRSVLPLKMVCQQVLSVRISFTRSFTFIKSTITANNIPDYHGFNTKLAQEAGGS